MAIHPSSSFPLLVSDQAEVIRIYLELLRDRQRAGRPAEDTILRSRPSRNDFHHASPPREMPDLD